MEKISVNGMLADELLDAISAEGFTRRHALSVLNGIYKKSIDDFTRIRNVPGTLIKFLDSRFSPGIFPPLSSETSEDGSKKYLFRNSEGLYYETVFIPDGKRNTVCVSTQSGCRMGCPFCVTGRYGFHGNLDAGDILNQVTGIPEAARVTHVVFMGMGEPLDNLESVMKSIVILTSEWGKALSPRNITVSTVGITEGVKYFLENSECNLTLSLFSAFTEERREVIPAENRNPVLEIIEMMRNYPMKKKRRLSVAYVMIRDVNDSDRHLRGVTDLLHGSGIRINLLPYHATPFDPRLSSTPEKMMQFKHSLVTSGISASIRKSRGADISAACGLLASSLGTGVV